MPPDDKMTTADRYRALAAHLHSRASQERNLVLRGQWANLAQCYMRLAEQADANSRSDIVYEFDHSKPHGGFGGDPD